MPEAERDDDSAAYPSIYPARRTAPRVSRTGRYALPSRPYRWRDPSNLVLFLETGASERGSGQGGQIDHGATSSTR